MVFGESYVDDADSGRSGAASQPYGSLAQSVGFSLAWDLVNRINWSQGDLMAQLRTRMDGGGTPRLDRWGVDSEYGALRERDHVGR
jgi:hypothetical protein